MLPFEFMLAMVSLLTISVSGMPVCQPNHACQISNNTLWCNNLNNSSSVFLEYCPNMVIDSLDLSGNNISRIVVAENNTDTASMEVRDGKNDSQEIRINIKLLYNLKRINLSHNQFHSFPSELSNGRALASLDLSFNKINKMNPTLKMEMLTVLNLRNNKLVKLEKNTFQSYPNLQTLDLSGNLLMSLKEFQLENCEVLNVSNNQVSKIEVNTFKKCGQLKTLDLSNNLQTQITRLIFDGIQSSLRQLDLSSNKLTHISSDAFNELGQLHSLNLSRNTGLKNINHIVFPSRLKTLELKDNSLREVDEYPFQHLKDIKHINLSGNNLSCDCHIYWIYKSFGMIIYINENSTCRNFTDNTDVPIDLLRLECLTHNCKSRSMDNAIGSQLNLTTSTIDSSIEVKWRSSIGTYRYFLEISDSSNSTVLSKYIDYDREYEFQSSSYFASYNVCVSAVTESKESIQKVCNVAYVANKSIIIGIAAGVLALCPCFVLLVYIVRKDSKYKTKLMMKFQKDKFPIDKQTTNTNGINEAFVPENTHDTPKTVPQTDTSHLKDPHDEKPQLSSSTNL